MDIVRWSLDVERVERFCCGPDLSLNDGDAGVETEIVKGLSQRSNRGMSNAFFHGLGCD
jgi:hypothetical protein